MPAHLLAARRIEVAADADLAAFGLALAGQHFDKLPLAVAGDACNADDLAAAHGERYAVDGDRAGIVERGELAQLKPGFPDFTNPWRLHRQLLGADHGAGHIVRREIGDAAVAGQLASAQDCHVVGKRHHLAEFMRDHQDGEVARHDHGAQHAQHLVGLARRQNGGRLVEDEKAPLQIELLQNLAFLALAGGNVGDFGIQRHLERHPRQERRELPSSPSPNPPRPARRRVPAPGFRRPSSPAPA